MAPTRTRKPARPATAGALRIARARAVEQGGCGFKLLGHTDDVHLAEVRSKRMGQCIFVGGTQGVRIIADGLAPVVAAALLDR